MNHHQIRQLLHSWLNDDENSRERNSLTQFSLWQGATLEKVNTSLLSVPDLNKVWGCDISHWDGNVNLQVTKDKGAAFVFIKGMDGTLSVTNYPANRQRAIGANLPYGPYHWLYRNINVSCIAQAQAADSQDNKYPPVLPRVVDHEWTYYGGKQSNPDWNDLRLWVTEYLRLGNPKPIYYGAAGYANMFGAMPSDLRGMFSAFWFANYGVSSPTLPLGFTHWDFWQFTSSASAAVYAPNDVNKKELDLNYYYSTAADFSARYKLNTTPPPVNNDVISTPFPGVKYITGVRYTRKFYLTICDLTLVRFEVAHANTVDKLDYPSEVAKRKGAQLAWNGGEWDKHNEPYMPSDLSVSNGVEYVARKSFAPSLIFFKDGRATIAHTNQAGQYNVATGLRYLIEDGIIKDYLSLEQIQYIECRARSIEGLDGNGHVMRLTVDGVYPADGMTLLEAAQIMKEFGAVKAFDTSGGGDSTIAINGITQNIPEDIFEGRNVERRVPEFLLAYTQTQQENDMTAYKLKNTSTDKSLRIRTGPSTMYTPTSLNIAPGASVDGDFLMTFKADLYTFDSTLLKSIVIGKVGDQWLHLSNDSGWSAVKHMGIIQGELTVVPAPIPVPVDNIASVLTSQEITVKHSDGSIEKFSKTNIELPKV